MRNKKEISETVSGSLHLEVLEVNIIFQPAKIIIPFFANNFLNSPTDGGLCKLKYNRVTNILQTIIKQS